MSDKALKTLQALAIRSLGDNERVPLRTADGEDLSFEGTYWVEFRDANAEERDDFFTSWLQQSFTTTEDGEQASKQSFRNVKAMESIIRNGLIVDAQLPKVDPEAPNGFGVYSWPKRKPEQLELIRGRGKAQVMPWGMLGLLVGMALEFYGLGNEEDDVVSEAKNLPTSSDD